MKLFKFYKVACGPCTTLKAYLNSINLPDNIELVNIDVGDPANADMIIEFEITSVPTLVFEDGRRMTGFRSGVDTHNFIFGEQ